MSPSNVVLPPRTVREVEVTESDMPDGFPLPDEDDLGSVDSSNLSYLESQYLQFLESPDSVTSDWRAYFQHVAEAQARHGEDVNLFRAPQVGNGSVVSPMQLEYAILQERVDRLIRNYRVMGHYAADIDPLGQPRTKIPELDPVNCGFSSADMERHFSTVSASGPNLRTLGEIVLWLRNTYCRSIGVQFMHIDDLSVREWLQQRMEATENRIELTGEEQRRIYKRLSDAVVFEEFILKKFTGAKSFSLEGAETLIPLLELAIYKAADQGFEEIVLGMAHRGRLNVLANTLHKPFAEIFNEFEDNYLPMSTHDGDGDVKYHLGFSARDDRRRRQRPPVGRAQP